MALKRNERYPGRFDNPSSDHPQGAFKNRSSPTSQDGTYLDKDWANDWDGFFGRTMEVADVDPNGNIDTAQNSQYFDALMLAVNKQLPSMSSFNRSLTANGYYGLPGGLLVQWGSTLPDAAGAATLNQQS